MIGWILALMLSLRPAAETPWVASYEATATAIADAVELEAPLFPGERGRERTAALLVAWFWYESGFRVDALGDHGRSFGLGQVQASNFSPGVTRELMLSDAAVAARESLRLLGMSWRACRALPVEHRGAWYASGSCSRGQRASAHRVRLGAWLFAHHPPPTEGTTT